MNGQVAELIKRRFDGVDLNGDVKLEFEEFRNFMNGIGASMSEEDSLILFRDVDKDGSGYVDFHEFVDYIFDIQAEFADLKPHKNCGMIINKVELRGITLEQIECVLNFAMKNHSRKQWVFVGGPKKGEPLTMEEISLYDICSYVISPATLMLKCSFVEYVADCELAPTWFVSHWWGEPHVDLYECLKQHCKDRGLPADETAYWICAYANNQHELNGYVTCDPKQSAFRLAMDACEGVVSVVDKSAMCWSRIWCCYEVSVCLESSGPEHMKYDMYTACDHLHSFTDKNGRPVGAPCKRKAVGITDGFAAVDGGWADYKSNRENHFPESLISDALCLKLEHGQASVDSDRVHILNAIVGNADLSSQPPEKHNRYEQLNQMLHGRIAASALKRAVQEGGEMFSRYVKALTGSRLQQLQADFAGCTYLTDEKLAQIIDALDAQHMTVLILSRCERITKLPDQIVNFGKLRTLNFYGSRGLRSLPSNLSKLPALKLLNIKGCLGISEFPKLGPGVQVVSDFC
eukprot:TRINITY_DN26046_c0_g1_i1.p1 TRINITY_DN26046_c0_g1~~TRINITY_DN26046_c0_g1_i1.p1  ORF type:complete len:518 (+),score=89.84 TRINITY_DN26046_c0_g1_i1:54-1607(+)